MKLFIILSVLAISSQSFAMTGVSTRSIRSAEAAASKSMGAASRLSYRPIISETDVSKVLRNAELRSQSEHFGNDVVFLRQKIGTAVFNRDVKFDVTMASQGKNKNAELVFDLKNLSSSARKKIHNHVRNHEWSNIGHFESRVTQLSTSDDSLFLRLELTRVSSDNLDNLRGIQRMVEGAFKIAKEDAQKGIVVQRIRPNITHALGAR